jgi:hypothetical protein
MNNGAGTETETLRGRLIDRGLDPDVVIGSGAVNEPATVVDLYVALEAVAATEKSGQDPTYAMARLALEAGLPSDVADTLFLAYNQQSAEEAGHGDKIFAGAFFAMGGVAPDPRASAVAAGPSEFLEPSADRKANKKALGSIAGALGGIEMVALSEVFPSLLSVCQRWEHPIGRDLISQIEETVRPEESRHVLTWRYVFHTLIAPKGPAVIEAYFGATNSGRIHLGSTPLDRAALTRMAGESVPTFRQLLGRERSIGA